MTVREIVRDYLKANGYDGLFSPGECGCTLDDLAPCEGGWVGNGIGDCEAGYRVPCDCSEECEFHGVDDHYHIGSAKPEPEPAP